MKFIVAEVTGSNPVEAMIFFRLLPSNWLNWKIYCDDPSSLSFNKTIVFFRCLERFSNDCLKNYSDQSQGQTGANSPMNQKTRVKSSVLVAISSGFDFHCLKNWREILSQLLGVEIAIV